MLNPLTYLPQAEVARSALEAWLYAETNPSRHGLRHAPQGEGSAAGMMER